MDTSERSTVETPKQITRRRRSVVRRSEEHTSELQSQSNLVCRLLLEKKKKKLHNLSLLMEIKIILITPTLIHCAAGTSTLKSTALHHIPPKLLTLLSTVHYLCTLMTL